ncbi:hypothetical protein ACOSP7_022417 [Xanthoceras sorbifolium]
MSEQSMAKIHPHVLLDAFAPADSEKILVEDWSPSEILPRSRAKALTQRSSGVLGRINLNRSRRGGRLLGLCSIAGV